MVDIIYEGNKPIQASRLDSGFDVVATDMFIKDDKLWYDTGVKLQYNPTEVTVLLMARSSLNKHSSWYVAHGLGLGDASYTGTYKLVLSHKYCDLYSILVDPEGQHSVISGSNPFNQEKPVTERVPYEIGDRIGQFVFLSPSEVNLVLSQTPIEGGKEGFGSTGK